VLVEEEAGTFTRLVVEDREDASQPARVALEVRSLADAKVKTRTKLPAWFHARMGMPPNRIGCRGTLCVFGVAPANESAQPTFEDDTLTLAIFDLKDRAPKLLPSVLLGPSPGVAFGPKNQLAVTFGSGADPVLVDPKTLAVRPLGRRGKKVDFMNATACIAFSANGSLIASTADREPVTLFETATGKRRWRSPEDAVSVAHWQTCGIVFAADGNVLDYSTLGRIQKLDVATGKRLEDLDRAQIHRTARPTAVGNESWDSSATISARGTFFVVSTIQQEDAILDTRSWKTEPLKAGGVFDPEERFYVVDERVVSTTTRKPIATLP
jgi:hypothetical protein